MTGKIFYALLECTGKSVRCVQAQNDFPFCEESRFTALNNAAMLLRKFIGMFIALPAASIDRLSLKTQLDQIGRTA